MKRRQFIKESSLVAVGIGVFGNVSWSKDRFIGDTQTTTDILGPFYRPGAPLRTNINPTDYSGEPFYLSGTIFKKDGKTPFKGCLIEIWQCDENKIYDNTSDDYRYRGSQKTGVNGTYHFITTHPVPYPTLADPSINRPAHFHLRISGEAHQDLITQIYFKNDPYIAIDLAANSPQAINRILTVQKNSNNEEGVNFDIVMAKEYKLEDNVYAKLTGIYKMTDQSLMEFYRGGDSLFWKWNGQILEGLSYRGNNEFVGGVNNTIAKFDLQGNGDIKVGFYYYHLVTKKEYKLDGIKILKY
jgi:catechol 1,2-dioxygenase